MTLLPPRQIRAVPLLRLLLPVKTHTPIIIPSPLLPQAPQAGLQRLLPIPLALLAQSPQVLVLLAPQELASVHSTL